MKFQENKVYNFRWPDGAIAEYTVIKVNPTHIDIMFSNGAENRFHIGSQMDRFSWAKDERKVDRFV